MNIRKMPIGVQDFEDLIINSYVYVDKTALAYRLVAQGKIYFLSRPRRFGKSLFLSTLKQYFLGNKDIFKGLAIEKLEEENPTAFDGVAWAKHPVIYIDLNSERFENANSLNLLINRNLEPYEKQFGLEAGNETISGRFSKLIRTAHEKTCRKTVVLVDEYDKPLLQTTDNEALFEEYRALRKNYDGYHFSKVSENVYNPFSVLNTFKKLEFSNYWFQTGTPTFLVNEIKRNNFDLHNLINGIDVDSSSLSEYSLGGTNPVPILMQSGYLTIKGYDERFDTYHLELPNEEVKYGFLKFLSTDFR